MNPVNTGSISNVEHSCELRNGCYRSIARLPIQLTTGYGDNMVIII